MPISDSPGPADELRTMLGYKIEQGALRGALQRLHVPTIVCLCGSTRFWEEFRDAGLRETLRGKIVLSIGAHSPDSITFAQASDEEGKEIKRKLDNLHKRKIDLADEVLVLNVGGYIGDSTRSEIEYAKAHGKEIRWLEKDD